MVCDGDSIDTVSVKLTSNVDVLLLSQSNSDALPEVTLGF